MALGLPPLRPGRCPGSPLPGGAAPRRGKCLRGNAVYGDGAGLWGIVGAWRTGKGRGGGGMEARDGAGGVRRGPGGAAAAGGLWHWGHRRTHGGCRRHWWGAGVGDEGNSWRGGTFPRSPKLHGASWGQRGGRGQGKQKVLAFCCPSLGVPQHGAIGAPTMLPTMLSPTASRDCRDQHTGDARVALTGETSMS